MNEPIVLSNAPHEPLEVSRARMLKLMLAKRSSRFVLFLVALSTAGSGLLNIYSVIGDGLPTRTRLLAKVFPLEFQNFSRSDADYRLRSGCLRSQYLQAKAPSFPACRGFSCTVGSLPPD
ncbi:MAG: hypothetical protein ACRD8U_02915 [Pyrinomonadaceae bacterium]